MSSESRVKEDLYILSDSITDSENGDGRDLDSTMNKPNVCEIDTEDNLPDKSVEDHDLTTQDSKDENLKVDTDISSNITNEIKNSEQREIVENSEFHKVDGKFSNLRKSDVEDRSLKLAEKSGIVNDVNTEKSDSQSIVRCESVCESDNKADNKMKEEKEGSIDNLKVTDVEFTNSMVPTDTVVMNPNLKEKDDLEPIDKPIEDAINKPKSDSIDENNVDLNNKMNLDSNDKPKVDLVNNRVDCKDEDVEMRQTNDKESSRRNSNCESSLSAAGGEKLVVCDQSSKKSDLPYVEQTAHIESEQGVFECSVELNRPETEGKPSNYNGPDPSTVDHQISPSVVSETPTSNDQIIETSSDNIKTQPPSDQPDTEYQENVAMETDECMGFGEMKLTAVQITPEEFENIASESDSICDSSSSHCEIQNADVKPPSVPLPEDIKSLKSKQLTNNPKLKDKTTLNSVSNENIKNLANMITKIKKEPSDEGYYTKLISDEKLQTTTVGQPGPSSSSVSAPAPQNISTVASSPEVLASKDKKSSATKLNNQQKKTPFRMISPKVTQPQFRVVQQVSVPSNTLAKAAPSYIATKTSSLNAAVNSAPCAPKKSESFNVGNITDILQRKHKIGNYKANPIPEDLRPYLKSYSLESCAECGDSFTSKDTLLMHEKRVSVTITYSCPVCKKELTFYNKCTFLGHIRLHNKEKGQIRNPSIQVKADILSITLPPKEKMCQIIEQNISPMVLASDISTKSYYCTECYKDFEDLKSLSNHFGCSEVMCSFNYVCNMCNMCFPRACSAEAHKRCHSKLPPYTCPECGIVIDDHEEFRHHIKNICFHFSRSYLLRCVNGGDSNCGFAGTRLNTFLKHLRNTHIKTKSIILKNKTVKMEPSIFYFCMLCSFSSQNKEVTLDHMQVHLKGIQRNATFVFTCTKCPQHFSSKQQLMTHNLENHFPSEQKKGVYLCSTCNTVTSSYSKYLAHQLQAHEMINAEFYICPDCKCLFEDPDSLGSHKILCNSKRKQATGKKIPSGINNLTGHQVRTIVLDNVNRDNSQSNSSKKNKTSPIIRNIQPKPINNNMQPNFLITKKVDADNGKNNKVQVNNSKTYDKKSEKYLKIAPKQETFQFPKVKSPVTHNIVLKIVKTTKHKCNFCPKEFSSKEEQEEHRRIEHSTFPCHLCGLTYDSQTALNNHIKEIHEGTKLGYFCFPCKKKGIVRKFTASSALEKHMIFKHRISKARIPRLRVLGREGPSCQSTQNESLKRKNEDVTLSPVKRLRTECSGLYTCVKCNFNSEDSAAFSAHIETHKTADATQCPECGLCFTVLPALKKHLFMVHKIRNADEYISEKGIKEPVEANLDDEDADKDEDEEVTISPRKTPFTDIEPVKPVRKEGPIGELECQVCYREFETVSLLKNHMRVHGMAFIRSRRSHPDVKIENEKD